MLGDAYGGCEEASRKLRRVDTIEFCSKGKSKGTHTKFADTHVGDNMTDLYSQSSSHSRSFRRRKMVGEAAVVARAAGGILKTRRRAGNCTCRRRAEHHENG
jgi:hypothetical protein